jgi:tartrate-resistant acid phosphatase type 5
MKKLIKWVSNLHIKPLVLGILLFTAPVSLLSLYHYYYPTIYRIPSTQNNAQEINLFALGDQGTGDFHQRSVASAMEKVAQKNKNLDFVILLGDNFYIDKKLTENSDEWNTKFEQVYSGAHLSTVPFYAVLGNHDKDLSLDPNTHPEIEYSKKALGSNRWRMPAHYYYNDFGSIQGRPLLRVVFLDTTTSAEILSEQAEFVREQFISNPVQPIWKIVVGHHTIRSYGQHQIDHSNLTKLLVPTLQEANVDIYMSGHDHNQQLIHQDKEPTYIVNGAGGRKLYPQKSDSDNLLFFREGYGFVNLKISATKLEINFYNNDAEKVSSHQLSSACQLDSSCIKKIK